VGLARVNTWDGIKNRGFQCLQTLDGGADGYQAALLFITSFVLNVSVCFVILMQLHLILKRLLCRASCLLPYVLLFFLLVLLHWIFSSFHIMMQLTENSVRVLHPTISLHINLSRPISPHLISLHLASSHLISGHSSKLISFLTHFKSFHPTSSHQISFTQWRHGSKETKNKTT